ncbi:MAG: tetratricopeptide repeat protein [Verrucomicrobiota bacterium]
MYAGQLYADSHKESEAGNQESVELQSQEFMPEELDEFTFFGGEVPVSELDAVELDGDEVVTPLTIIGRILEQGDGIMAKSLLDTLLLRSDLTVDERALATMLQASLALDNGDVAEGIVWLHSWLDQFPHHIEVPYVHFLLGQCYMEVAAYDRARENFYLTMSTSVLKVSNSKGEATTYPMMLSKVAKWALAETEYQRGNWPRARELFARFKKQEPGAGVLVESSIYREADCAYQMHQVDEAIELYNNALAVGPFHPFSPEAWLRLVQLYGLKNEHEMQVKSLNSFIWVVKSLDQENAAYWRERCAKFLLANWRTNLEGQVEVLDTLSKMEQTAELEAIRRYYLMLLNRDKDALLAMELPEEDQVWQNWKQRLNETETLVQEKIEVLRARKVRED